jgi:SAM-dependent methyltransferase
VRALQPLTPEARWLDYGCGHGGLVQYVNAARAARACGYDEGAIVGAARERGIPILGREECLARKGAFDVVTAIEVLEHVTDPLAVIAAIRALLKPGGLFFYTTGNARPHRKRFVRWSYVVPEIHNCYFEPETAEQALRRCGLRPDYVRRPPGWTDIIRYKVLKNLSVRRRNAFEAALPWSLITRIVDARYGVTHFPVGWAASGLCRSPASPLGRRHGDPPHLGAESPNR